MLTKQSQIAGKRGLGFFLRGRNSTVLGGIVVEQNSFVVGGDSAQPFDQLPTAGLPGG
jgi:hypothetical protein